MHAPPEQASNPRRNRRRNTYVTEDAENSSCVQPDSVGGEHSSTAQRRVSHAVRMCLHGATPSQDLETTMRADLRQAHRQRLSEVVRTVILILARGRHNKGPFYSYKGAIDKKGGEHVDPPSNQIRHF